MSNTSVSRAIDVIKAARSALRDSISKAERLLLVEVAQRLLQLSPPHEPAPDQRTEQLIRQIAGVVEEHSVREAITGWPFENFWSDPPEPAHSGLLGYFLNPEMDGGSRMALFLDMMLHDLDLQVDQQCRVEVECGGVDVLLSRRDRKDPARSYTVIIENKVHGAPDQPRQLERYYNEVTRRFTQVYGVYLPFSEAEPCRQSQGGIPSERVHTRTYRDIERWLRTVVELPGYDRPPGMRHNVSHYLDLIGYLRRWERSNKMRNRVLEQLESRGTACSGTPMRSDGSS
jgi:hypothetical protein